MYEIRAFKDELEIRAASILGSPRIAFQVLSLRSPRFVPFELGFNMVVTWLYGYYYESGKISLPFLLERFQAYEFDHHETHKSHYEGIRRMRTFLQHNLNLDSSTDWELKRSCEQWFMSFCSSTLPGNEEDWEACLMGLLLESKEFLSRSIECVREIERDESRDSIVGQWEFKLRQYHPKHEFERLVNVVIRDMGQDALDSKIFCDKYYDRWSRGLRLRTGKWDFDYEARRLIEQTMMNENEVPLPITGGDIIREFGIRPGPEVGILMRVAKDLYYSDPCTKSTLLERLATKESPRIEGN